MMTSIHVFMVQATPLRRILAFLLDLFLLFFVILSPFGSFLSGFLPKDASAAEAFYLSPHGQIFIGLMFVLGLFVMAYFVLMEWLLGTTMGKLLLGLRVVSAHERLTLWQCIVRSMFAIPAFPFIILWLVDPLMMLLYSSGQRLSEILSQTQTIYVTAIPYTGNMTI